MTEPAVALADDAGGLPPSLPHPRRAWQRKRVRRLLVAVLVVGAMVGCYFIARSAYAPRFTSSGWAQSGPGHASTPYTYAIPIELDRMPLATQLTAASVIGLPPGLHAKIVMMRQGDYSLSVMGFPGDPADHHSPQLVPVDGYRLHAGSTGYADLMLTLRADEPGRYTMHGLRLGWRAGPFWGTHAEHFTITLRVSGRGADAGLTSPTNPLATSGGSI